MNNKPKAIDLFCGCGGLSYGLKKAGFNVLAAVEILPHARETYKANHPEVEVYGDIRTLKSNELLENHKLKPGELDLLAGCPPCQGFSRMRTRNRAKPANDERNELIFEFLRLAIDLFPKAILMENVPGLIDDNRMTKTLNVLKNKGYDIALDILDASTFGVPQRRKRMILYATRVNEANLPIGNKERQVFVEDIIRNLPKPGNSGIKWHDSQKKHSEKVMNIIRRIPKNGGSRSALGDDQLPCHKRLQGFRDVYGRMAWNKFAPTITRYCTNPSKGRFLHPSQNRAITLYEASLLQSFPKSYKFPNELCRTQVESMIGEALPPKFAEAQARHVMKDLLNTKYWA